jgi:TonB family protein
MLSLAAFVVGVPHSASYAAVRETPVIDTPGSVALLVSKRGSSETDALARAVSSENPMIRAVAARVAGVAGRASLAQALAIAFERETDAGAAVEQAGALLFLRGAAARDLVERRTDTFPLVARVYAEWAARVSPQHIQVPATAAGGLFMRTIPHLWPGFMAEVLRAAKCSPEDTRQLAVVLVRYRADGRVSRITPQDTHLSSSCMVAGIVLAALSLADRERAPVPGEPETLVLPLNRDYIGCDAADAGGGPVRNVNRVFPQGSIQPPQKVRNVTPEYPSSLQKGGVQGLVVVEAVITTTGCVGASRVLESPEPLFSVSALSAVSRWRFTPTTLNGVSVPVIMTVTVNFSLQ